MQNVTKQRKFWSQIQVRQNVDNKFTPLRVCLLRYWLRKMAKHLRNELNFFYGWKPNNTIVKLVTTKVNLVVNCQFEYLVGCSLVQLCWESKLSQGCLMMLCELLTIASSLRAHGVILYNQKLPPRFGWDFKIGSWITWCDPGQWTTSVNQDTQTCFVSEDSEA